jgi:hypothetical protein
MSDRGKYEISEKEIEVANLFSRLGYFVRCHLQIYPTDLRNQASDIDVFAARFDSHLTPETNLVEVKEGYSKPTELFQLFGFKTYFHPNTTYLICKEILEPTLQISKKLDIRALSFDRLHEIVERDLKFAAERKSTVVELERSDIEKTIDYLLIIKKNQDELFWRYHYLWLETNPYSRFYSLQSLFSKSLNLEEEIHEKELVEALHWYGQELFCLSLLDAISIASDCISLNQNQVTQFIQDRFYNIGTSKEGKLKVRKGIATLVEQIDKLSKGMIKMAPIEVIPGYVGNLISLVLFLIKNAPYVQPYLLVDSNVQKINLKGKSKRFTEFATSELQSKKIEEMNSRLLDILYEGKPISMIFDDFV